MTLGPLGYSVNGWSFWYIRFQSVPSFLLRTGSLLVRAVQGHFPGDGVSQRLLVFMPQTDCSGEESPVSYGQGHCVYAICMCLPLLSVYLICICTLSCYKLKYLETEGLLQSLLLTSVIYMFIYSLVYTFLK